MVERSTGLEATVTALDLVVAERQGRLDRARQGRLGRLVARLPANRQGRELPAPRWTPAHVALAERLDVVATALGASSEPGGSLPEAIERFTDAAHESGLATEALAWCGAVAAFAAWPTDDELDGLSDAAALDGTNGLLEALWQGLAARFRAGAAPLAGVEVIRDAAIADVTLTAGHGEAREGREGRDVERMMRETAGRWSTEHGMKLVTWQDGERPRAAQRVRGTRSRPPTAWVLLVPASARRRRADRALPPLRGRRGPPPLGRRLRHDRGHHSRDLAPGERGPVRRLPRPRRATSTCCWRSASRWPASTGAWPRCCLRWVWPVLASFRARCHPASRDPRSQRRGPSTPPSCGRS